MGKGDALALGAEGLGHQRQECRDGSPRSREGFGQAQGPVALAQVGRGSQRAWLPAELEQHGASVPGLGRRSPGSRCSGGVGEELFQGQGRFRQQRGAGSGGRRLGALAEAATVRTRSRSPHGPRASAQGQS